MASKYLTKGLKRSALTVALGLCFASGVQAQSTAGRIYGTVPSGATVVVKNTSGLSRSGTADETGRYSITSLPIGTYTVTVESDGKVVGTRTVTVLAGAGVDASVGSDSTTLETVTVVGASIPLIDITATDTRSILTAAQLQRLPIGRTAESIALLAPGAVSGAAGFFGGLVSFGGAGVSENAYYVNGYFTGEPLSNLGGFGLPFGSIAQQETFIGGYSAKYGRSDGGVINQIGKRGDNDWHFGGQIVYTPENLRGDQVDRYYPNVALPEGYEYTDDKKPGTLYSRGSESNAWRTSYSAYAGGPIVTDRLFFYVAADWTANKSTSAPTAAGTPRVNDSTNDVNKIYAKVDWNITDNHFLELTYLKEDNDTDGVYSAYNFATATKGEKQSTVPDPFYQTNEFYIGSYTGYLTDNLTLSVTAGRGELKKLQINPSIIPGLALLSNITNQNPALNGGTPISNLQGGYQGIDAKDTTDGIRADLEWVMGDHTFTAGIDNITFKAEDEGITQVADRWIYSRLGSAATAITPGHVGKPPAESNRYYAYKLFFETATSMKVEQKAWYLEDRWQVSSNLMLSLGLRNDKFTNSNNFGAVYLDAKDQWAPRLGFAWDVNGDSSFKIFGNAGRYFLAMPNNVAIRGASASTFTRDYYSYTGIAADGTPTGLTPIPRLDGQSGPYSSNGEYGQPIDVLSFAPSDLKNMYQDEFILGFEAQLSQNWMLGAKLTFRDLKSAVDDICDPYTMSDVLEAQGIDTAGLEIPFCLMFNPGGTNTFSLANIDDEGNYTGTRTEVTMSSNDWRFPDPMKREYKGLDIYMEHAFDGKWEARVDYTFSKGQGNMEGQVKSEFGQSNISKTQDWDAAEIMTYANGYLANDRRHQLKVRGSYQFAEEWLISGNVRVMSGAPISCLGYFNPGNIDENDDAADPIGYGSSYHTCFGEIATPGSLRTPWTRTIDLGVTYRPSFADKKLSLALEVRNLSNERETTQVSVTSEDAPYTVSNTYLLPIGQQTPRTVTFIATYDW